MVYHGDCEVWWAGPELARPAHLALLDATELDPRERLRDPEDRSRFTVAAALLRLVVSRHTGDDPAAVTVLDEPARRLLLDARQAPRPRERVGTVDLALGRPGGGGGAAAASRSASMSRSFPDSQTPPRSSITSSPTPRLRT